MAHLFDVFRQAVTAVRPIIALVCAAVILLFIKQYTEFTDRIRPRPMQVSESRAAGQYDVRITCTFEARGNAFGRPALRVKFRDRVLIERTEAVAAGELVEVQDVPDVQVGWNEFLIEVTPAEDGSVAADSAFSLDNTAVAEAPTIARAVNIQIRRDDLIMAERVIWSSRSGPFGELVRIGVDQTANEHEH